MAHPETNGARSHYYRIDLAPIPNPTSNDNFTIIIGFVAASDVNNAQFSYNWTIPAGLDIEHGTLRVIYFTGFEGISPDPTSTGISSTYNSCGDITIKSLSSSKGNLSTCWTDL